MIADDIIHVQLIKCTLLLLERPGVEAMLSEIFGVCDHVLPFFRPGLPKSGDEATAAPNSSTDMESSRESRAVCVSVV